MIILYNLKNPETEEGYYITIDRKLTEKEQQILEFLVNGKLQEESKIKKDNYNEVGPLVNFNSPWCSNALSILKRCGINFTKIEKTNISKNKVYIDRMTSIDYKTITKNINKKSNENPSKILIKNPQTIPVFKLKSFSCKY